MGTIIEHPTDLHLQKVWAKLDKMVIGQKLKVKDEAPNFPGLWIKCVKMYQDCFPNVIEFNSNYSIARKMDIGEFLEYKANA